MRRGRVQVRRERPTALSWSIALTVTMLVVYVLTLQSARPDAVETVAPAPRVTRTVALEAIEGWCVVLGEYPSEDSARMEAASDASRGSAGCVVEGDGKWRVLGAMYEGERDARRVAARLQREGFAEADVLPLTAEALTLRITAPDQQIDAIAAVDAALLAQVRQLGVLALQLDRGDIRPDGARTLCAVAQGEVAEAGRSLARMPGATDNGLCAALVDAAGRLADQLGTLAESGQDAPAALSGMMRLVQIETFLRLRSLREGLITGG